MGYRGYKGKFVDLNVLGRPWGPRGTRVNLMF